MDYEIPEVLSYQHQPRFFNDKGKHFVEISTIGAKDTVVHKVTPEIMARFRDEWNAYCDGRPIERRAGTPLTVLKEISQDAADDYQKKNLHTLEELAVLSDHQCQGLGHGLITLRKKAQQIVMQRKAAEQTKVQDKINAESTKSAPAPDNAGEIAELKSAVEEQGKQIAALIAALTPKQPAKQPAKKGKKDGAVIGSGDSDANV